MIVIHDRERDTRSNRYSRNKGEGTQFQVDYSRLMTERGETISSASWESINGFVSIANQSLAANIATADITVDKTGMALIKVSATQSDGNKRVKFIEIQTIDPESSTKDYT